MRVRMLGVLLAALVLGGCAFTNPVNTPLLTALDGVVQPGSTEAQIALGSVFVPVGVGCGALDVAVVHPIQSLGFAAEDTRRALWSEPADDFSEEVALAVPKALFTPVVYAFFWVGESLFDLRPQERKGAQ